MSSLDEPNFKAIRADARAWVLRLADPEVASRDHEEFDAWIGESPHHARAYAEELDLYYAAGELKSRFESQPRYTRAGTLARRGAIGLAATACVALVITFALPREDARPWSPPVATQIAEVRDIELPDGSIVTLGADTSMELAFNDAERRVRLSEGEAFFRIAHNAERPFFVETDDAIVRVVGTEFEVKSTPDRVRVTVAHGIVEVSEPRRLTTLLSGARTFRLEARQEISVSRAAVQEIIVPAPPSEPAAWRDGFLVYQDASLAEVIADANRYSRTPIRIVDPELARLRVTASFPTEQIGQMLSSLEATMPLRVERTSEGEARLIAVR